MLNIRYYALKFSEFSGPHDTSWLNLEKYQIQHFYINRIDLLFNDSNDEITIYYY